MSVVKGENMNTFSITDVGKERSMNQDFVFASTDPIGNLPNLFVVADGMGGHKAGDYASKEGVGMVISHIQKDDDFNPIKLIRLAMESANQEIYQEAKTQEGMEGMGTTMVVATIIDHYMYVANVGDSRLYVINETSIHQVTRDHSLVEEMVRSGGISKEEAKHHSQKNVITRAIGGDLKVNVDFFDVKLKEEDVILLCSDGLYNMVEEEEMKRLVNSQKELSTIGEQLIQEANKNGGLDNIGLVLIRPDTGEVKKC